MLVFHVTAAFDSEANVWYVSDTDVPGLVTEAETYEALLRKCSAMIPELLRLNHHELKEKLPEEVHVNFSRTERVSLAAA